VGTHARETVEREARIVSDAVCMANTQEIALRVLLEQPNNKTLPKHRYIHSRLEEEKTKMKMMKKIQKW
jgi:hypothetical protein